MTYTDLINFIRDYCARNPGASKAAVKSATVQRFSLKEKGAAYDGGTFAVSFSSSSKASVSNTVCGLRKLAVYDSVPFIAVVVTGGEARFVLANSTFLKRISLASHKLRVNKIRGSFNFSDIVSAYDGIPQLARKL